MMTIPLRIPRRARWNNFGGDSPFIPYGRQSIDENDIDAVVQVLKSDWLTTGPSVEEFENAFASFVGARCAVAVSSGTAALHTAMSAVGIGPGDQVVVPPLTFAATANAVVYQGGHPIFADIDSKTLLLNPEAAEECVSNRTRALVAVDYAGQPCDYDALRAIADRHGLVLIADACHSLGAEYRGKKTGTFADVSVFSFHPVKHITTGEGGMITTDDPALAARMRRFRNHGIDTDHRQRAESGTWHYEMVDLGYNYRLNDISCALGTSQLRRLPETLARRREIASAYDRAFSGLASLCIPENAPFVRHAYHLYPVRYQAARTGGDRGNFFRLLREQGIGANVHYLPVHLHPYYQKRYGYRRGDYPVAEAAYDELISLPLFPAMTDGERDRVIEGVRRALVLDSQRNRV
ncbi:MAG: UDP-4-amino-4,6-dideoxy-N-acetyl-beta-L-altrosamine transaminase [Syntrophales bacterium]|jgi:perosamine synthetase|nr:UDP-4-amino-4,6-dideoxy-N-acetyl-beta-L-altrosamine transaminase [Syntrophales bacterium]